jgi:uncharacterized membrane protein
VVDYPPPNVERPPVSVSARLWSAGGIGAVVGAVAAGLAPWQVVPLSAWCATALTWVAALWWRIARLDAAGTAMHATYEEPARGTADALLLSASLISLGAVLLGVEKASSSRGDERAVLLGAGVLAIIASWLVVHTLFTLRYADLYYCGLDGGIDFNQDEKPTYADFAYLAFTIGMTYQVSDTNLTSNEVRRTALRHALLSYLFGTVIIAATINLAAGLVK